VFGVLFGVFMYFWQWRSMGMSIRVTIVAAAVTGALFGVLLAAYYKWSAHRLKLPDWEHYTPLSRADRDGPHI
jgi:multisubunit Na+/H+ antiporter MnhG subunit